MDQQQNPSLVSLNPQDFCKESREQANSIYRFSSESSNFMVTLSTEDALVILCLVSRACTEVCNWYCNYIYLTRFSKTGWIIQKFQIR